MVWERNNPCWIFCDAPVSRNTANLHFIRRSYLSLGIKQNIMTNCLACNEEFEKESRDDWMHEKARQYFKKHYDELDEEMLIYHK